MAVFRFGTFELDGDAGELHRLGRRVHLTGQPLNVLECLAARAGQVVTREELRAHIWGASRFVDFDRSLNFCIASIRTALGDSARSPRQTHEWTVTGGRTPRRGRYPECAYT